MKNYDLYNFMMNEKDFNSNLRFIYHIMCKGTSKSENEVEDVDLEALLCRSQVLMLAKHLFEKKIYMTWFSKLSRLINRAYNRWIKRNLPEIKKPNPFEIASIMIEQRDRWD